MENNDGIRTWADKLEGYDVPSMITAWVFMILLIVHPYVKFEGIEWLVANTLNDFQVVLFLFAIYKGVQFRKTENINKKTWLDKIFRRKKPESSPVEQAMKLEACKIEGRLYTSLSNIALAVSCIVSYLLILHG